MATSNTDRRGQAMLGELPADFLRIVPDAQQQQVHQDAQMAQQLQQASVMFPTSNMSLLKLTVVQAKLAKNYSLVKMDPYCRIRLGNGVFETPTAHSGGKNPRWNKTLQCYIKKNMDSMYLEIYDERAFSTDDKVAWAHIQIPQKVFCGETNDEWYMLNGKQGDGKEGMINLIMEYTEQVQAPVVQQPTVYSSGTAPVMMIPAGMPVYYPTSVTTTYYPPPGTQQQQQPMPPGGYPPQQQPQHPAQQQQQPPQQPPLQQQQQGPLYTEDDVKQIKDVFPDVDDDVIKSLLEVNCGNKDTTINQLLSMQETS